MGVGGVEEERMEDRDRNVAMGEGEGWDGMGWRLREQ